MMLSVHALMVALLVLETMAPTSPGLPAEGPAESNDSVREYTTHLLDRLAVAEWELPGGVSRSTRKTVSNQVQPFWFSAAGPEHFPFHRRVVLGYPKDTLRDMRDGLLLPVPSSVSLPVYSEDGNVLVFTVAMLGKPSKGAATVRVQCIGADGSRSKVWEQDGLIVAELEGDPWPPEETAVLPDGCVRVSFEVTSTSAKLGRGLVVWQDPRLERPIRLVENQRYNVLFIVVDALRSDVVGSNNTAFPSVSPAIDALQARSAWFPKGYANSNTTLYSMNTMLLGLHPSAWGAFSLWQGGEDRRERFYRLSPPFLTRTLHSAGFVTYGASHNHLYFPGYKWGVDPGFDVLQDCGRDSGDHPILVRRALQFMERNRKRRFLVQVNLIAPHQPYNPPAECLTIAKKAVRGRNLYLDERYLGEVCWADKHVGMLLEGLEGLGLQDETIVVLTADHGEVMDNHHDCYSVRVRRKCRQLHGNTLYDEEIRVPLMFSLPGRIVPAAVTTPAQHVDIVPTLLALLGLEQDDHLSGMSLVPLLLGQSLPQKPVVYAEKLAVRAWCDEDYKIIWHGREDDVCPKSASAVCKKNADWLEMYDTKSDPEERQELSRSMPEKATAMRDSMVRFRTSLVGRLDNRQRARPTPDGEAMSPKHPTSPPFEPAPKSLDGGE